MDIGTAQAMIDFSGAPSDTLCANYFLVLVFRVLSS